MINGTAAQFGLDEGFRCPRLLFQANGFLFNLPIEFPLVIRYDFSGSVEENEDCVQRCEGLLIRFCNGGRKLFF